MLSYKTCKFVINIILTAFMASQGVTAIAATSYQFRMPLSGNKPLLPPDPEIPNGSFGFSKTTLDFGEVPLGSSGRQTVQLINKKSYPINIYSTYLNYAPEYGFSISSNGCAFKTLAAGSSCTITLEMQPRKAFATQLPVKLESNFYAEGTDGTLTLPVKGFGLGAVPSWAYYPDWFYPETAGATLGLNFKVVPQNSPKTIERIYLANLGSRPGSFSVPALPAWLQIEGVSECGELKFMETCPVDFIFNPAGLAPGVYRTGPLILSGDVLGLNPVTVTAKVSAAP